MNLSEEGHGCGPRDFKSSRHGPGARSEYGGGAGRQAPSLSVARLVSDMHLKTRYA
jgi:hypothetical protein